MSEFSDSTGFTLREDLLVEEVDGEVIVLDLAGNKYFGLNSVGWSIWQALEQEEVEFGAIVSRLVEEFGISRDIAREDVEAFLLQLIQAGLLGKAGA